MDYVIPSASWKKGCLGGFLKFLDYKIRNLFFHPLIKETTIPDYEIQKPQMHFWKKKNAGRARILLGGKSNTQLFSHFISFLHPYAVWIIEYERYKNIQKHVETFLITIFF